MVAVRCPLIHFHQGLLRQVRYDVASDLGIGRGGKACLSEFEEIALTCILPKQFPGRHLALVEFPDGKPKGQQAHQEHNERFPVEVGQVEVVGGVLEQKER